MNYKIVPEFARGMLVYNVYVAVTEAQSNGSMQVDWVLRRSFKTPRAAQEYVQELNTYGKKR
ncbi:MAG: hypothetical protein J6V47_05620 [Bacteroidaceae bacterium]|nr:hypothetical protein [Bacteroidaceae bacterium]